MHRKDVRGNFQHQFRSNIFEKNHKKPKENDLKNRFNIEDHVDLLDTENINYLDFNVFEENYLKMLEVKQKKFVVRESALDMAKREQKYLEETIKLSEVNSKE